MQHTQQSFRLKNSFRKTVALEIMPDGTLLVRAPKGYSKKEAEAFIEKNLAWVEKHRPGILNKNSILEALTKEEILLAKKCAKIILTKMVAEKSAIMGLTPKSVKITSAQKRFGSCSSENAICFSYLLMFYPIKAIEYVVVHELAHIAHHNHSKQFHEKIKEFLPEEKEQERLLKIQNFSLENFRANVALAQKIQNQGSAQY